MDLIKILKVFTELSGPSGFEDELSSLIFNLFKDFKEVNVVKDEFNNVYVSYLHSEDKPTIALFSHIDEVGFIISDITEDGFIKFKALGGWSKFNLSPMKVKIMRKDKIEVTGIIPSEFSSSNFTIDDLYIDVGASSKEDVLNLGINIGDYVVPDTKFTRLSDDKIISKALDDRICASALVKFLFNIINRKNKCNVIGVFTSQEEVGCRGAKISSKNIDFDLGIAIDVTDSFDIPSLDKYDCKIGNGIALSVIDQGTIGHRGLINYLFKIFKNNKVKISYDPMTLGGTDSSEINITKNGLVNCTISLPVRYMHSPYTIASLSDVNTLISALKVLVNNLTYKEFNKIIESKFKPICK
ncbi:MAG: hypothetical protein IAC58_01755 [Firmicutes bacterium]|uniref:Uncharacterized protein n=1 Tax=Candidatus Onthovivens merdipullorum TaxID=2840889 RepID=A0A9D9DGL0_9BACL|nr:hypothetical protein [Candidatus Onthovivens merdipullorum]